MIKLFCERLLNISSFVCKKNYDHSSYTSRAMASFQKFCLKNCKSRAIVSNAFSAELTQKNLNFSISKTKAENEKIAG